jgi:predicted CoA-substrate-specific enzyme activase
MMSVYLGVDIGSVSTNLVLLNDENMIIESIYLRTKGNPIAAVKQGMEQIENKLKNAPEKVNISGVGVTGSGRKLIGVILGADIVKNEITAHAIASMSYVKGVNTIIEIGGQDSKLIILENNVVKDFSMNSVCAAGTGSFLDRQAERLGIKIEDFGRLSLGSKNDIRIAGRCAVFAESDMIHKQQLGYSNEDIVNGLCEALVRNYMNNLARGKNIREPIVFQGGVAANIGIQKAFEKLLGVKVIVPKHHKVMGAIGSAILAKEEVARIGTSSFVGFKNINCKYEMKGFSCSDCPNICEILEVCKNDRVIARWGDKCGKWQEMDLEQKANNRTVI